MFGSGISFNRFCACGDRRLAGMMSFGKAGSRRRRSAGQRVEDRKPGGAQIARAFRRRGNAQQRAATRVAPRALIIAEVEELVLHDRAADRAAELVPLRQRDQPPAGIRNRSRLRERISRLHVVVAQKFERDAVHLVGAGLRLRADDAGAGHAELGVVIGRRDLGFSDGFECGLITIQPRTAS